MVAYPELAFPSALAAGPGRASCASMAVSQEPPLLTVHVLITQFFYMFALISFLYLFVLVVLMLTTMTVRRKFRKTKTDLGNRLK